MKYIDLTEEQGGGGSGGTTNYNKLSNQPQINNVTLTGNKTSEDLGLMSDANFLPDGYTINLKADGTGDFATIQDAINSLNGKVCSGTVSIELEAGTYNISTPIIIGNVNGVLPYNIANIRVLGNTMSDTIINCTDTTTNTACLLVRNGFVLIENLTLKNDTRTTTNQVLTVTNQGRAYLRTVKLQNGEFGLNAQRTSETVELYNCTIDNTSFAIYAGEGGRANIDNSILTITNAIYALRVWSSGQINIGYAKKNFTNVTNETNQTIGNITADGMILGQWQN